MLITVTLGGVVIGSAVVARHRAQSAADLAALAAAARVPAGPASACRQAEAVAGAMHATLRGCDIDQLDVIVTVAVAVSGRIGSEASAAARAGPAG
jgi:secretion/DNA translocation related TadE-like protein